MDLILVLLVLFLLTCGFVVLLTTLIVVFVKGNFLNGNIRNNNNNKNRNKNRNNKKNDKTVTIVNSFNGGDDNRQFSPVFPSFNPKINVEPKKDTLFTDSRLLEMDKQLKKITENLEKQAKEEEKIKLTKIFTTNFNSIKDPNNDKIVVLLVNEITTFISNKPHLLEMLNSLLKNEELKVLNEKQKELNNKLNNFLKNVLIKVVPK